MFLPVMLVSAAPPGRAVSATAPFDRICEVRSTPRETGNATHWRSEYLLAFTSSDPAFGGVEQVVFEPGCNGFPAASPCVLRVRHVPSATMNSLGSCEADGMDSPDYWEGTTTQSPGTSVHNRARNVMKGFGEFRGLEFRGEVIFTDGVGQLIGWIIETGGY